MFRKTISEFSAAYRTRTKYPRYDIRCAFAFMTSYPRVAMVYAVLIAAISLVILSGVLGHSDFIPDERAAIYRTATGWFGLFASAVCLVCAIRGFRKQAEIRD